MSAFLSKLSAKDGIINNGAESEVTSGLDSKMENLIAVSEAAPGSDSTLVKPDRCVLSCFRFGLIIRKTWSLCPKLLQVWTHH